MDWRRANSRCDAWVVSGADLLRSLLVYLQQLYAARYQHRLVDGFACGAYSALLGAEWRWLAGQRASHIANSLISGSGRVGNGLNQAIASV